MIESNLSLEEMVMEENVVTPETVTTTTTEDIALLLSEINQNLEVMLANEQLRAEALANKELLDAEQLSAREIVAAEKELFASELLTNLDSNFATYLSLYEEETLRIAEEPTIEEPLGPDYSESLANLEIKLDSFLEVSDSVEAAANSIVTYSIMFIPLVIIIFSLYWFFSQFLNRFY